MAKKHYFICPEMEPHHQMRFAAVVRAPVHFPFFLITQSAGAVEYIDCTSAER